MILAVGYRVRSPRGTQFRQWATAHLREFLVKGFVMDDERLKNPGGWDYFDELLARIREIRPSESCLGMGKEGLGPRRPFPRELEILFRIMPRMFAVAFPQEGR